jgi:hypothetical protein
MYKTGNKIRQGSVFKHPVTWSSSFATPPNIATNYEEWLSWKNHRIAQFELHCPVERAVTYYCSDGSSAADDTNPGTRDLPFQTRAKALAVINASGGNVRMRFQGGNTWDDDTDFVVTVDNVTIDAYDWEGTSGTLPFFNAFELKYGASGWTLAAGNRYTRAETNDIAWVRDQEDRLGETLGRNLVRVASSAACEALSNSWFWGSNVLHINLGGTNPNTKYLEAVISNTANGVEFRGDGCRVENIRADGFGMNRTSSATQAQPFTNRTLGNESNYYKGLEGFYSGTHIMAHNQGGDTGGRSMWVNCIGGFPMYGAAGDNIFNSYSRDGGQETWFINCECRYGTLKSSDWSYSTLFQRGNGFYAHTISASYDPALFVAFGVTATNSHSPILTLGGTRRVVTNPSPATDFSQYRAFVVNCTQYATNNAITTPAFEWYKNEIIYGCRFSIKQTSGGAGAWTNYYPDNTWVINCDLEMDQATVASNFSALYNTSTADNKVHFLHTAIRAINAAVNAGTSFGLDYDNIFGTTTVAGSGTSRNSTMTNSVLSVINSGNTTFMRLSLTNSSTALKNNVFYDVDQNAGFDAGYNLGTSQGTIAAAYTLTSTQTGLQAGDTTIRLSHDINGKRRTSGTPYIGPVDFS